MFILRTTLCFFLCMLGGLQGKPLSKLELEIEKMSPYIGEHRPGVDTQTLHQKVICGYQGWFTAKGDGSKRGWVHYSEGKQPFGPGACTFDLWPDMSELDDDEKYITPFKHKNGDPAYLFSSRHPKTVMRHFKWMKDYGIDGVILQRFGTALKSHPHVNMYNTVMKHVQAGANYHGRSWALMYDLSGMKKGEIRKILMKDWKHLVDRSKILEDKAYIHHKGKPLICIWGVGFGDDRKYDLKECAELIEFFKRDTNYGNNTVLLGVPTYWRTLERDATKEKELHEVLKLADIVSPWTVGRYENPVNFDLHHLPYVEKDLAWTRQNKLEYMPVAFPGFSWKNLMNVRRKEVPSNHIPRLKGQFLWSQAYGYHKSGADMIYLAMFDEIDEGTALFKCTNHPPVGESTFIDYEGLPSDHYLWLSGKIGELFRGETQFDQRVPKR